jgi:antirestriction protein ArdC
MIGGEYWVTFKQCQSLGGKVKKGAKSVPIIFYTQCTYEDKTTKEEKQYFKNDDNYYSTPFHEIIHGTGHKNQLCRKNVKTEK